MVIKGGMISWSNMGDPNASLPTPQPMYYRPAFGGMGKAMPKSCISFVSKAAFQLGVKEKLGLERMVCPVLRTRQLTKADMFLNGAMPRIDVDSETFEVRIDGELVNVKPAERFPLGQMYWFS